MGKRRVIALLLMSVIGLVACSNSGESGTGIVDAVQQLTEYQSETEALTKESSSEAVSEEQESTTEEVLENISIYYGNGTAKGLKKEEVSVSEVTPDALIGLLSRHNIVSMDTKVHEFEEKKEAGKQVLYLSLSKQFKNYINLMGADGEYIVIAGLTNTFLDSFQADSLVLTIMGEPLVTEHNDYSKPLTFFELQQDEKKDTNYRLTEVITDEENIHIVYPHFEDMKDQKVMEQWNQEIQKAAMSNYQEEGLTEYTVSYEITTQNAGMISMVLRGSCNYEESAHPTVFESTFNLDLTTGKNKRLEEYGNLEELAKCLKQGYGYQILNSEMNHEELTEYLDSDSLDDYVQVLKNYDYNFSNKNQIPTGFSYIKDDQNLILVVEVNHAMGDYLEVQID